MAILVKSTWTNAKRILVSMAECVWIRLAVLFVDVHLVSAFFVCTLEQNSLKALKDQTYGFVRETIFFAGFKGQRCEIVLEQCDTNPCQNDALCFIHDDSYECYCVPDFHGERCQYKYNDCMLPPLPKLVSRNFSKSIHHV